MGSLTIFKISQEAKDTLGDPELFRRRMEGSENLLSFYGFSDEAVIGFYDAAVSLMEKKRFEEAFDAFYFLIALLPNESLFWLGAARSSWHAGNPAQGVAYYLAALQLKPCDTTIFAEAVHCCFASHALELAKELIEQFLEQAANEPDAAHAEKMVSLAKQAEQELAGLQ